MKKEVKYSPAEIKAGVPVAQEKVLAAIKTLKETLLNDEKFQVLALHDIPLGQNDSEDILVEILNPALSKDLAIEALCEVNSQKGQDPKLTIRRPGIIQVGEQTLKAIRAANDAKLQFVAAVKKLEDANARRVFNRKHPTYSYLQIRRQITVLEMNKIDLVDFFWHSGFSVRKKTVKEWSELWYETLSKMLDKPVNSISDIPADLPNESDERKLQRCLEEIQVVSMNEKVAERRVQTPHPRVYIKYTTNDGKVVEYQYSTPVPIVVPEGTSITEIKNMVSLSVQKEDKARLNRNRTNKFEEEPLVKSKSIVRYKAAFREFA